MVVLHVNKQVICDYVVFNNGNEEMFNYIRNTTESKQLSNPIQRLSKWYRYPVLVRGINLCIDSLEPYFKMWSNGRDGEERMYTAAFKDPYNGESFLGGRMIDSDNYEVHEMVYDSRYGYSLVEGTYDLPIREAKVEAKRLRMISIDVVWYPTKEEAKRSAAGKALDCLNYREFGLARGFDFTLECKENPYSIGDRDWDAPLRVRNGFRPLYGNPNKIAQHDAPPAPLGVTKTAMDRSVSSLGYNTYRQSSRGIKKLCFKNFLVG